MNAVLGSTMLFWHDSASLAGRVLTLSAIQASHCFQPVWPKHSSKHAVALPDAEGSSPVCMHKTPFSSGLPFAGKLRPSLSTGSARPGYEGRNGVTDSNKRRLEVSFGCFEAVWRDPEAACSVLQVSVLLLF